MFQYFGCPRATIETDIFSVRVKDFVQRYNCGYIFEKRKLSIFSPQLYRCTTSLSVIIENMFVSIESSKLACDTGGHCTNYPTWPLPRTNPNVDVLNNSLNYYALADLMLYCLSVNIKHITLCLQTL